MPTPVHKARQLTVRHVTTRYKVVFIPQVAAREKRTRHRQELPMGASVSVQIHVRSEASYSHQDREKPQQTIRALAPTPA